MSHRPFVLWTVLATAVLLTGARPLSAQPLAPRPQAEEDWQVIYIGENRIGYSHTTRREITVNDQRLVRWSENLRMQFKRFGQQFSQKISMQIDESLTNELQSFRMESLESNDRTVRVSGTVRGNRLELITNLAGKSFESSRIWKPGTRSMVYERELIRQGLRTQGQRASFDMYMPMTNKVIAVRMEVAGPLTTKLHDGTRKRLTRLRPIQPDLPVVSSYADADGRVLKTETEFFGKMMTTYSVSREVALQEIAGAELDIAVATLVPVHTRDKNNKLVAASIPKALERQRITYRIRVPGVDPRPYFLADANQTVRSVNDETIELTVTRPNEPRAQRTQAVSSDYTKATRFLQSTDPRVVDHARRAAGGAVGNLQISRKLESYVHQKVGKSNFSTAMASAAEVAKSMEGDCTEHAVLLAAMLRARRIPSRVAIGVVYVDSRAAFGGHAWTEAYIDGQWYPLDAMLGKGGIGPAHIKMAQSSFADDAPAPVASFFPLMSVLGKMQVEVVSVK
ncbi:MAG: transglutaminase-like domain-containing protein [Planctomycetota bacterium]|nr:transglutaminase-like domain-containing protein [Planctomycetota bacterium]